MSLRSRPVASSEVIGLVHFQPMRRRQCKCDSPNSPKSNCRCRLQEGCKEDHQGGAYRNRQRATLKYHLGLALPQCPFFASGMAQSSPRPTLGFGGCRTAQGAIRLLCLGRTSPRLRVPCGPSILPSVLCRHRPAVTGIQGQGILSVFRNFNWRMPKWTTSS